jgi:hypothetical protein
MRGKLNRKVLIALLLVTAAGMGCNPFLFPSFVAGWFSDDRARPEYEFYKLARKEKDKKDIKVVVVPERGSRLSVDQFNMDGELARMFVRKLEAGFEENKDKVKVVPLKDVNTYKSKCSSQEWRAMRPQDIGKHFEADYVMVLELSSLSLYEKKSFGQFFRGSARVTLTLVDVDKDEPVKTWDQSLQYPKDGRNQIADMDKTEEQFRTEFFDKITTKLVRTLTASREPNYIDMD